MPGTKCKFAVYPDYATGRKAQAKLLKEDSKYIDLTLNEFVRKYTGVKPKEPDTQEVLTIEKQFDFLRNLIWKEPFAL